MERIQEMLQASPEDNFLRHALALEYIKMDNDAEAEKLFKAILSQSPDYVGSYYHLAKLLERNGNTKEAIDWYERGMQTAKKQNDMHAYNELQSAYEDLVYWFAGEYVMFKFEVWKGAEKQGKNSTLYNCKAWKYQVHF